MHLTRVSCFTRIEISYIHIIMYTKHDSASKYVDLYIYIYIYLFVCMYRQNVTNFEYIVDKCK